MTATHHTLPPPDFWCPFLVWQPTFHRLHTDTVREAGGYWPSRWSVHRHLASVAWRQTPARMASSDSCPPRVRVEAQTPTYNPRCDTVGRVSGGQLAQFQQEGLAILIRIELPRIRAISMMIWIKWNCMITLIFQFIFQLPKKEMDFVLITKPYYYDQNRIFTIVKSYNKDLIIN